MSSRRSRSKLRSNGKIIRSQLFEHVFIQPAAGDAGGALGAAWATYYIYQGHSRKAGMNGDKMHFAQTGPQYTEHEIQDFWTRITFLITIWMKHFYMKKWLNT